MKLTNDGVTQKIYTVSELNANIKALLEEQFPFVWICGEISNFRRPVSGHAYFTLKDDSSQMNAVMFRGQQKQLKFELSPQIQTKGNCSSNNALIFAFSSETV